MREMERPVQLAPGVELWSSRGISSVEQDVVEVAVRRYGHPKHQESWIAWIDALCLAAGLIPPNIVIVHTRPTPHVLHLAMREVPHE